MNTATIKASELKPLQRFWSTSGVVHITVRRNGLCGFMSGRPGQFDKTGKITHGTFNHLNEDDVLALALDDGTLLGLVGDTEVIVEAEGEIVKGEVDPGAETAKLPEKSETKLKACETCKHDNFGEVPCGECLSYSKWEPKL